MLKAAFVLCLQMLQSATNRQLWATYFTELVGRAAAIGVGLPTSMAAALPTNSVK